jgi:hypothetical protein
MQENCHRSSKNGEKFHLSPKMVKIATFRQKMVKITTFRQKMVKIVENIYRTIVACIDVTTKYGLYFFVDSSTILKSTNFIK